MGERSPLKKCSVPKGSLYSPLFHLMGVEEIRGILLHKVKGGNCN